MPETRDPGQSCARWTNLPTHATGLASPHCDLSEEDAARLALLRHQFELRFPVDVVLEGAAAEPSCFAIPTLAGERVHIVETLGDGGGVIVRGPERRGAALVFDVDGVSDIPEGGQGEECTVSRIEGEPRVLECVLGWVG